jgi:pimeloyl-ACP methyl ester carboxylesterase
MTPFVEPLLQAGFAVWAFDGPGHGISSGRLTSGVALANALLALADQWGPPAGVIAHSIGGWAAVHAALLGAEFPKIVLISAPDNPADFLGQVADTLGLTEAAKLAAMKLAERRLGLRYHQIALSPRLGKLPSDALIVHDRQDREIPLHVGEKIAAHWPGARALWTEGLGHRRILRDPQVLGAVVRFFQEER